MADSQKIKPTAWDADALDTFAANIHLNPMGPLASAFEVMHGAHLYEYTHQGQRALVAVKPLAFSGGNRLDIVGLASLGDRLQGHVFAAALDDLARMHQARYLACLTQVPHVVKLCTANGFSINGVVLTKPVGTH